MKGLDCNLTSVLPEGQKVHKKQDKECGGTWETVRHGSLCELLVILSRVYIA